MDLHKIIKLILTVEERGLNKVRLAKTVYFVHKELIRNHVASSTDIKYIRMPLGPVPDGFMEIATKYADILVTERPTGLAYNSKLYSVNKPRWWAKRLDKKDSGYAAIKRILGELDAIPTSVLVEISHSEPSWVKNVNGVKFYISEQDMKHRLPLRNKIPYRTEAADEQSLQASLVNGMLKDIVEESTDLEFPSDG